MTGFAEWVAGYVDRLRHTTPEMGVVRVALALLGMLLVVVVDGWTAVPFDGYLLWVAGVLVVTTMLRPDGAAPGVLLGTAGLWWLAGSGGAETWQHVTVASLLAAVHVVAAQAGAAPSHATVSGQAGYVMFVGSGAYVVAAGALTLLVATVVAGGQRLASPAVAAVAAVALAVAAVASVLLGSRR